jgi:hypothetical protein
VDSITGQAILRELAEWEPEGEVVSAYVKVDPGDRSAGWRTELRHALDGLDAGVGVGERVLEHFPEEVPRSAGRAHAGFIELGGRERELWYDFQLELQRTLVASAERPHLAPLVELVDDGWQVGVVLVALETVRVLERALGKSSELAGWELEITSLDWRERKASHGTADAGTASSASGHDQYRQRLDHNRERFLKEAGRLVESRYGDREWRSLIVIGETDRPELFAKGLGPLRERVHEVHEDLIRASTGELETRLAEELEHLNRSREEQLVARLNEAIGTEAGAALGPDEVLESVREGRASEVLYDGDREWEERDGVSLDELLIEAALATSAHVTPVEGVAAEALAAHDGAAAILRY